MSGGHQDIEGHHNTAAADGNFLGSDLLHEQTLPGSETTDQSDTVQQGRTFDAVRRDVTPTSHTIRLLQSLHPLHEGTLTLSVTLKLRSVLQGIESSPAGLESGTHVFAFGDDLFYTRLQPERGFDTLDEDFNYAFLVLTLMAMLIGSAVCQYMVRKSKLAKKWK